MKEIFLYLDGKDTSSERLSVQRLVCNTERPAINVQLSGHTWEEDGGGREWMDLLKWE